MSTPTLIDDNDRESRDKLAAIQARSDARFEAMQTKIDARFDAMQKELRALHEEIYNVQVTLASMQAQMMTKDEFHAFLDTSFRPMVLEVDKAETRINRMTIGLIMGALILFSGLVFQSQRSVEHALAAHTAQSHSGQTRP